MRSKSPLPALLLPILLAAAVWAASYDVPNGRPPAEVRAFVSPVIDELIVNVTAKLIDPAIAALFNNCFPNPLDTTVNYTADGYGPDMPDTFVITGDIPAMWLRDAMNQLWGYLPYASRDPGLQSMLAGVINRMAASVLIDSYANAFNYANEGSPWQSDHRTPPMNPKLWEGKYELDTIISVLRFAWGYYNATGDATPLQSTTFISAVKTILATVAYQQTPTLKDLNPFYTFQRDSYQPSDSLLNSVGSPGAQTGMAKSAFRPSDDATTFPFLVPANAMAASALADLVPVLQTIGQPMLASQAAELAEEINNGLLQFATRSSPTNTNIWAYEVDGYASANMMDDANVPSLLSLPYLGFVPSNNAQYAATRAFILSPQNPYYFNGTVGAGVGSPHTGIDMIWPLGIMMQAITSTDDDEIMSCLDLLTASAAGTGFMHESFNVNNATDFTRPWFAWANAFYGQVILTIGRERPYLLYKQPYPEY